MKFKDKVVYYLAQHELARNKKFKDLHKGQSCYIFGNGVSLKSMELEKFNDKIAIGCNSLFLHKDFDKLDCRYYQIPPSLLFYPYRKFYGKYQRNFLGDLYREKITQNKKTQFFLSLSNCLNMRGDNISYTHHFGHKRWESDKYELDGIFSFMEGATHAMLGTAMYMGFSSAVLVGVDYICSPKRSKHFFEKGNGRVIEESSRRENSVYGGLLFNECAKRLDFATVTLDGVKSNIVQFKSYSEYVGTQLKYKENTEIVDVKSLEYLHKLGFYNIY